MFNVLFTSIFTASIWRIGEGNIFNLCVSPHLDRGWWYPIPGPNGGGGVPHPRSGQYPWYGQTADTPSQIWMVGGGSVPRGLDWVPPHQGLDGVPPPQRTGWSTPPPIRQSNIASTCYAAGGMPLCVNNHVWHILWNIHKLMNVFTCCII